MIKLPLRLLPFVLILPAVAVGQDYQILLDRPEVVGNQQMVHAMCRSEQRRTVTMDTAPERVQNVTYTITIDALREVLSVSDQAQPTKVKLTITQAVRSNTGRGTVMLLPAGAVVIMDGTVTPTIYTDEAGAAIRVDAVPSLRMTFHLSDGQPRYDQSFGSKEPQHVGAVWPIDSPATVKMLQDLALTVDPAKVSGSTTLAEQLSVAGQDCLQMVTTLNFTDFSIALMPGVKVTKSSATLIVNTTSPTDIARPRVQETRALTLHMEASGHISQNGVQQTVSMGIDLKQNNELTYTAAPTPAPGK